MKRLSDCTHFDADRLPPCCCEGETRFYYRQNRRSFRVAELNMGAADRELLHCGSVRWTELRRGAHFRREKAHDLSIEYVHSGTLQFRQEGRGYELSAGEVFLFFPGLTGEFYACDGGCGKISILVNGRLLGAYLETGGLTATEVLSGINTARLDELIRDLDALSTQHGIRAERENSFLTWRLLDFLRHPALLPQFPSQLAHCEELCLDHLGDPHFSVQELARMCSLSVSHFIRLFRRHFGETPYRYLTGMRMRAAARMLVAEDSVPVKEVAESVGYRDPLNFSTEFKKFFGIPPTRYADRERL